MSLLLTVTPAIASTPREGTVCMTVEHLRAISGTNQFLECSPLSDKQMREYKISGKYLGVWNERNCTANDQFDEIKQRCVEKKKLHRQQSECRSNPGTAACMPHCQAANIDATLGNDCDWPSAALQPDPSSRSYFLQCTRQSPPEACGQWSRVACAPGTAFDAPMRICISLEVSKKADSACSASSLPICSCAQQTGVSACPGQAESQLCCHALPTNSLSPAFPPSLLMNQAPLSCPGSVSLPVSMCSPTSGCPVGTSCNVAMGACCPITPSTSVTVVQLCPNGSPSSQSCGYLNECPKGTGCYQGACCPVTCSSGACAQQPIPLCVPQIPKMPICPNGQTSTLRCTIDQECGPAMECSSGGCCPMPYCPSGIQAIGRCLLGAGCANTAACVEGLCCPLPQCADGAVALRLCVASTECGRGFDCNNGGCCPLPSCPGSAVASQR
ncbi:unnamed protein product [Toxocara canis]|uniref:Chitin-binding type-2 domain-containing protein n=1 Tax=Toxocara canis TaxID=6265 RepID=A0A183UY89_TOXCA|nr:unnamed protein product [Toxocara canis]